MRKRVSSNSIILLLLTCLLCAQTGYNAFYQAPAPYTSTGPDNNPPQNKGVALNGAIGFMQISWTVTGAPAACTVAVDSAPDGSTWSAGGAIVGQTCTSNGNSAITAGTFNFIRINVTALSAGGSLTVRFFGWTQNPVGGAGNPGAPGNALQAANGAATAFVGVSGWTTNGSTTITGGGTSILNLGALGIGNIVFPTETANTLFGNCSGVNAAPGYCVMTANMIPATINANTTGTASNLSGAPLLPAGTTAVLQPVGTNNATLATTGFVLANASGSISGLQGGTEGFIPIFSSSTGGLAAPAPLQTAGKAGLDRCGVWNAELQKSFGTGSPLVNGDPVSGIGDIIYAVNGQIECDTNPLLNGNDGFGGGEFFLPSGNIAAKTTIKSEMSNFVFQGSGRGSNGGSNPTNIQAQSGFPNGAGVIGGATFVCNGITGGRCRVASNPSTVGCNVGAGTSCSNVDGGFTFTKGTNSGWNSALLQWTGGACTTYPAIGLRVVGGVIVGFDIGVIGATTSPNGGNQFGEGCTSPPTATFIAGYNGFAGSNMSIQNPVGAAGTTAVVQGPIGSASVVQIGSTDNIFLEAQKFMWFGIDCGAEGTPSTPGTADYLTGFQDFSSQEEGYFDGLKANNCGVAQFDLGGHSDQHQNGSELNNIESIWPNGTNCPSPTATWEGSPWPAISTIAAATGNGDVVVTLSSTVPLIVQTQEVTISNVPLGSLHSYNFNTGKGFAGGDGNTTLMITSPTCANCSSFHVQYPSFTADNAVGGTVTPWPIGVRIGGRSNIGGINHDTIGAPGCINPTVNTPAGNPAIWTKAGTATETGSVATFTATSGAMPAGYTVGATGFMTGCSVLAYNEPLTIISSSGNPGVVTYNVVDPLGNALSGLGAATGCTIKLHTVPVVSHDLSGNNFHTNLTHEEQYRTGYQFGTLPIPTQGYWGKNNQCSNDTFNSTGGWSCVHISKMGNLSQPNFISSWLVNINSPGPVALGPNNLLDDNFNGVIVPSASVGDLSAYYDVNGYPETMWDVDNSLTSFTAAEVGNVVSLTTTNNAAKLIGNFAAQSTIFVYGCSVAGYNVGAATIQSVTASNVNPGVITYNAPTSGLGAATGCIAVSNVLSGFTFGSQPGLAATAPIPDVSMWDNNHQKQWDLQNTGFETNSISQSTIGTQSVIGADYTNSTTGATTVVSWALPKLLPVGSPAKTYHYSCDGIWESTAATLTNLILNVNLSSATGLGQITAGGYVVTNTTAFAETANYISTVSAGNQTVITSATAQAANTPYPIHLSGTIETAPIAATTFSITATETAAVSQTVTIKRGFTCQLN